MDRSDGEETVWFLAPLQLRMMAATAALSRAGLCCAMSNTAAASQQRTNEHSTLIHSTHSCWTCPHDP